MSRMGAILLAGIAPAIIHNSAYASNLDAVIPDLYEALDVVSRELVGFIPSVTHNPGGVERAAVGQTVDWFVTGASEPVAIVPGMTPPEPAETNLVGRQMMITNAEKVDFGWTGEEQRALSHSVGHLSIQGDLFAQGLRSLVNKIERDVGAKVAAKASRAYGTAGTTPFNSTLIDAAHIKKILDDNGASLGDRSLVIDTTAGVNLRGNGNLTKVNEAGSAMTLRQGELLDLHGFSLKESAGVARHTKGSGASATTDAAGYAEGATVITLASAGTGAIKAGDVVTFAGDANKYLVAAGDTDVSGGGTITLAAPGLRQAIPAAATAITLSASFTANAGFVRNAVGLAVRAPAVPQGGDAAIDSMVLVDPRSGLAFEVRLYAGYRKVSAEVAAAWGTDVIKPEHVALLLG